MLKMYSKNGFDCIVLPGGLGGAKAMAESSLVGDLLKNQEQSGKFIAAICAGKTYDIIKRKLLLNMIIFSSYCAALSFNWPRKIYHIISFR